jgi:exonuclease III
MLARLPVRSAEWHVSRPGRSALDVRIDSGSNGSGPAAGTSGIRLVGLHLSAGLSMRGERLRLIEVASLLRLLGSGDTSDAVLVGDFNSIAPGDIPRTRGMPLWLRLLLRVDGGIRTDVMTQLFSAGWIDAFRHLAPDDAGFTLPPADPSVRLDYVLVPVGLAPRLRACRPIEASAVRGLVRLASDHLPLLAELDA